MMASSYATTIPQTTETTEAAPPSVSVIIPVYNGEATIARAIASAQRQTLKDIDIIVVDDASTDNTAAVVENIAKTDPRIKTVSLKSNLGAGGARNAALNHASGTWIAVLDADDWYEPDRLETLLRAAESAQADAICDNLKILDHCRDKIIDRTRHGHRRHTTHLSPESFFDGDNPLRPHAMGYVKPMVRKAFLTDHAIRYDPAHRSGQDFIFLAEILLKGGKAVIAPEAKYVYRHRISPTTRKISPHSRSGSDFRLIVRGCDELLARYGATMTPRAHSALQRRRWIFEARLKGADMLDAWQNKSFAKALRILLRHPMILALMASTAFKTACARLKSL